MLFRWRMQLAQLTLYLLQLHLRCSLRELATMVPMVLLLSVPCTHVWKMPSTRQAQADGFVALILCMIAGEKCGRKVKCSELMGDGAHAFWQILARLMRHSGSNSREAINTEWHERSWKSLWPDMFMWERIHITWVRKITFKQIPAEQYLIVRMLGQLPFQPKKPEVAEMEIVTVDDLLEIPGIGKAAFGQYGEAIGLSFIVQMVLMFVFFLVVRRVLPHEPDQVSLADVLFSMVFFPILAFAAVWASLELRHSVESRWQGTCFWSDLYLVLYVSRMLCHVLIQPFENMSLALLLMMTFHHLVSMGCLHLGPWTRTLPLLGMLRWMLWDHHCVLECLFPPEYSGGGQEAQGVSSRMGSCSQWFCPVACFPVLQADALSVLAVRIPHGHATRTWEDQRYRHKSRKIDLSCHHNRPTCPVLHLVCGPHPRNGEEYVEGL